ncbi:CBF-domain-containing protein [Viridothelium virens]|uniref:CBF-domain-containing protein n=1 Tax=Viridothelium virens TaxID=1048519 RepID=A0A6A6H0J2_VIRVR|nr:CBF-domain-containing protein [Viridothelium virens]
MPHAVGSVAGQKRKLPHDATKAHKSTENPRTSAKAVTQDSKDAILLLETEILESRRNYNNIASLLVICNETQTDEETTTAAVALCRVFCRLTAAGDMTKAKGMPENEVTVIDWLRAKYAEYTQHLQAMMRDSDESKQSTAMVLTMRLVKESASKDENIWRTGLFCDLLQTLLSSAQSSLAREELVEKYVDEYDDVRFFTLLGIMRILGRTDKGKEVDIKALVDHSLEILMRMEGPFPSSEDITDFLAGSPPPKHVLRSSNAHKKAAQDAWLSLLRQPLTRPQRKAVLNKVTTHIAPVFSRPELLMDFLTTSFDIGGAVSLLALSGLFHLITTRNLDYPKFYTKLYSLIDADILHSKYRSRFFRLLDTFLSSTHLPATLVASFIKRLSRLVLTAPPAGIIAVVPFIYNMLQRHRQCTFMLHRDPHPSFLAWQTLHPSSSSNDNPSLEDPFLADEPDPTKTLALESSLWELDTLRSHYHPNVATLAGIIAQQFTKREYQLEDFLDHSYASLVEAELGKEVKKAPVVEWEIPKRIFSAEGGGLARTGSLLEAVRAREREVDKGSKDT